MHGLDPICCLPKPDATATIVSASNYGEAIIREWRLSFVSGVYFVQRLLVCAYDLHVVYPADRSRNRAAAVNEIDAAVTSLLYMTFQK